MSNITIPEIAQLCADHMGTTVHEIRSTRGQRGVASAIGMTAYLARRHTPLSYAHVAEYLDTDYERVRRLGGEIRQRVIWSKATAQLLSKIEEDIDRVHESKMELMSA